MTGVAVKTTGAPVQVGLEPVVIAHETDGTAAELTTTKIPVLMAVNGLAHPELEIIVHVTV